MKKIKSRSPKCVGNNNEGKGHVKKLKSSSPKSGRNNNEVNVPKKRKFTLQKYTKNKNTHKKHNSFATSVARRISPDDKQAY